ncbi:hypothetical protein FIBSPDRAFT_852709 [Athelia psychrophila]|uniref:Uncharacterized protein n=1 Tax=Athelia psychrophila TaxID=1759441 RepID=A0A166RQX3_9AGAM|nr:hypothetical protein FIBSPDRAFT_852709 [Fibularhizoctonia sp. CBS 109695]
MQLNGAASPLPKEKDFNETEHIIKANDQRDNQFLVNKKETEGLSGAAGACPVLARGAFAIFELQIRWLIPIVP